MVRVGIGIALLAAAAACGTGVGSEAPDAGTEGTGGADAAASDGGRRALCPIEPTAHCSHASQCMSENERQSNCAGCRAYNHALCRAGNCTAPPRLGSGDITNIVFPVGILKPVVKSFSGHVIAAETAGGSQLRCEDVYEERISLDEPCYNILDSRGRGAIAQTGDVYPFPFSGFASGQHVLFVIYGYAVENSEGNPIGVSCTERDIGSPGVGAQNVAGDMMRRFQ